MEPVAAWNEIMDSKKGVTGLEESVINGTTKVGLCKAILRIHNTKIDMKGITTHPDPFKAWNGEDARKEYID